MMPSQQKKNVELLKSLLKKLTMQNGTNDLEGVQ